jgi:hypothetical protein
MDVQEQRVRFVIEATQGVRTFGGLCAAYEISRPTGYPWLQHYRESGVAGIAERSRKPHHSSRRTASELEQRVVEMRLRYPDWGARTLWRPSPRRYDPHPPRWEYPPGAWVLKVDCQGKLDIGGQKWRVSKTLAGEWVQLVKVEQRMLVFDCNALIRELDPGSWPPTEV